ncbi:pyridoxamine 5'-phosphate oxidase family protein [Streptomyces sp. MST-110588]|uniref:pyridoxamine 5'-phosphate oxidase family protein n=1 Tax=Streptomyces sp. MST-110588 TaxID=2833628 RepID=UPI001F5DB6CA|nr:pyridoxamine 5'-phosphate oxidase family protein [Streptomyces sp. MST-110588]UNO41499.1 pyridoxamine 5'-phosphate oxidase family protein [Streptomyces sp. MST-110588]
MTSDPTPEALTWTAFAAAEPALARHVQNRFGAHRHHILGTLRRDGSVRLCGLEADFRFGELWLGMMNGSRKAQDLRRDPRFALHANPGPDTDMAGGDVRVAGRAVEVHDPDLLTRYAEQTSPPQPFHLFRAELTEVVRTYIDDPHIVVETWRPGRPSRTIRRTSENPPPPES